MITTAQQGRVTSLCEHPPYEVLKHLRRPEWGPHTHPAVGPRVPLPRAPSAAFACSRHFLETGRHVFGLCCPSPHHVAAGIRPRPFTWPGAALPRGRGPARGHSAAGGRSYRLSGQCCSRCEPARVRPPLRPLRLRPQAGAAGVAGGGRGRPGRPGWRFSEASRLEGCREAHQFPVGTPRPRRLPRPGLGARRRPPLHALRQRSLVRMLSPPGQRRWRRPAGNAGPVTEACGEGTTRGLSWAR